MSKNLGLKAVDFFCGGGGMSYGMQMAGINILAGIDYDEACKATYEANIKDAKFLRRDVFELVPKELESELGLRRNDKNLILIGCSPCQFWSIINTDRAKSKRSSNLLKEFKRFVEYFQPGFVVVENVPGVFGRKKESGLAEFIDWLRANGYAVHNAVHNVKEFGVPQSRKRFTLIANRVTSQELEPEKSKTRPKTVKDKLGVHNGIPALKAGEKDKTDELHRAAGLAEKNRERLKLTPHDGGNRLSWAHDDKLQVPTYMGRDDIFIDSYSRMWWGRPSPTITTKFFSISNGRFAHPEEDRAISLREGAILQSFPKRYNFIGSSNATIARMIGNAVPPEYARRIGTSIIKGYGQRSK